VTPSIEDQDLTDHFIQAGKFLKVEVIDHLIISDETYHSFVDSGSPRNFRQANDGSCLINLRRGSGRKGERKVKKKG